MVRLQDGAAQDDLEDRPLASVLAPATVKALAKLGPVTVGDLLRFYPRRYLEPGSLTELGDLVEGDRVVVVGEVSRTSTRRTTTGRTMMEVVITDGSDEMRMVFFAGRSGRFGYHQKVLTQGRRAWFSGDVKRFKGGLELVHPTFAPIGEDGLDERATWPRPVYPAAASIDSFEIAKAVAVVLDPLHDGEIVDPLPQDLRRRHGLLGLVEALHLVHRPHTDTDWHRARARLRFEEAFVLQVELARRRHDAAGSTTVPRPRRQGGLLDAFDRQLPFVLTGGQVAVGDELADDLARTVPMRRLLQGDVGAGKTVVALRAMLQVVDAGGQAVMLAPTEVLAAQHLSSLRTMLGPLGQAGELGAADTATRLGLLTGSQPAAARRETLAGMADGSIGIVVGTHALLSEHVALADLGLVVVDEQHRFGVEQRDALRGKSDSVPHTLVMTATPIPRTVAMTVFGDLETSTLTELPAGRAPVTTHVVPADRQAWLDRTWARVAEEVRGGGRAYVVAPRIDPHDDPAEGDDPVDERRTLTSVVEIADQLAATFDGIDVGLLHGRMPSDAKEAAFADFAAGRIQVLVATTVVEVGVDVPEATVMVVMDADRFGVSQLHQLRGRVGRGGRPGLCLLVSGAPEGSDAARRLAAVERTTDGFELSRIDLELRRGGDVLGSAQSGTASSLRLLRVTQHEDVIVAARAGAQEVVAQDPTLGDHPALAKAVAARLAATGEEFLDRA
jgi:ATP-dependent DNA helicase RecG